jgi:hypothetical protein
VASPRGLFLALGAQDRLMPIDVKAQMDELFKASEERSDRYLALLPRTGDVSLVVLKGHLMIEEMMIAIAANHCPDPDELAKARLTFAQLHHLVRALLKLPLGGGIWEAISLLNAIRNSLVHNLEPKELDARISALYLMCQGSDEFPKHPSYVEATEPSDMAARAISFVMGALSVIEPVSAFFERNLKLSENDQRT